MKFGIFYEHQLPRPWTDGAELKLFQDALSQVELADKLGIDFAWEVEHHFLEEYSHSSAPEVFLAAASQRTKNIRLGHGIMLMPPATTIRRASRSASPRSTSFRTAASSWAPANPPRAPSSKASASTRRERRAMWREAVEQVANMMAMDPYPGFQGKYFSMPARNVVPKPVQKPHPPLWVACSNRETIHLAAQLGIGALTFAFVDPAEAKHWVDDYYETFKSECVPIGHAVNPNIAMVTSFSCHPDAARGAAARLRWLPVLPVRARPPLRLRQAQAGPHRHLEAATWRSRTRWAPRADFLGGGTGGIGTPDQLRAHLDASRTPASTRPCSSSRAARTSTSTSASRSNLFAERRDAGVQGRRGGAPKRKKDELAPYVEAAFKRKEWMEQLTDDEIPEYQAYGAMVAEIDPATLDEANRARVMRCRQMREILAKA